MKQHQKVIILLAALPWFTGEIAQMVSHLFIDNLRHTALRSEIDFWFMFYRLITGWIAFAIIIYVLKPKKQKTAKKVRKQTKT